MEKVKAKIKVNDYKIENSGIIENDVLVVQDNETEFRFNLKELSLTRKNKEMTLVLDFKNNRLEYMIPEIKDKFINNFIVLSLTNMDKEYNIKYQMEDNVFDLLIRYETMK